MTNPLVPLRIPKLDQGMWQQPDATIQWLRDTRLGMFIHWGATWVRTGTAPSRPIRPR